MSNFINLYKKKEISAINKTGTYPTMSFTWKHAEVRGFQTSIKSFSEVSKFIDTMQENRFDWNFDTGLLGKITKFELEKLISVSNQIFKFSKKLKSKTIAKNTLSRCLVQYRIIRSLLKKGHVLEIGPGSGLLGALIGSDKNYKYTGLEVCQAFYITQHEIWKYIFGDEIAEHFNKFKERKINHVPWWNFADLDYELPKFDCVTANHVFAEMHEYAMTFTIKRIHTLLKDDGLVICEGIGSTRDVSTEKVMDEFLKNGFSINHIGKIKKICGFVNVFIFKKMPKTNPYAVNPHLFIKAKGKFFSRKTLGHLKRGVFTDLDVKFENLITNFDEVMTYNKKAVSNRLNQIDDDIKPSKNDVFLRYVGQS